MPDDLPRHPDFHDLHTHAGDSTNFFPGQREGEKVHLCIRRHWLIELAIFGKFFVLAIIAPLLAILFLAILDYLFNLHLISGRSMFNLSVSVYLLFVWLYTFVEFMKNELSIVLITNERVIDIEQTSLFDHSISEANLDRIQDVLGRMHGFLGMFFDVGDLEIQTAGKEFAIITKMIKLPQLTARKILNIQRQSLTRRRTADFSGTNRTGGTVIHRRAGDDHLSDEEILRLRSVNSSRRAADGRTTTSSDV